jgi:hypothetical protein
MGWDEHDSHETAAKAWNRRSLTYYMGWDKYDMVCEMVGKTESTLTD